MIIVKENYKIITLLSKIYSILIKLKSITLSKNIDLNKFAPKPALKHSKNNYNKKINNLTYNKNNYNQSNNKINFYNKKTYHLIKNYHNYKPNIPVYNLNYHY